MTSAILQLVRWKKSKKKFMFLFRNKISSIFFQMDSATNQLCKWLLFHLIISVGTKTNIGPLCQGDGWKLGVDRKKKVFIGNRVPHAHRTTTSLVSEQLLGCALTYWSSRAPCSWLPRPGPGYNVYPESSGRPSIEAR